MDIIFKQKKPDLIGKPKSDYIGPIHTYIYMLCIHEEHEMWNFSDSIFKLQKSSPSPLLSLIREEVYLWFFLGDGSLVVSCKPLTDHEDLLRCSQFNTIEPHG